MNRTVHVQTEAQVQEEYLQISENILRTIPMRRPPVGLHFYDEKTDRIREIHPAARRVPSARVEEIETLCREGNLFLSKAEYASFAEHLSRNLGALLTEHVLDHLEVARLFHTAFTARMREFILQATEENLALLRNSAAVFCEYLWISTDRLLPLFSSLSTDDDLAIHSVNSLFVGMALRTRLSRGKPDTEALTEAALGLLLHDIGMIAIPRPILCKQGPLVNRERASISQHPLVGFKILSRLNVAKGEILQCLNEHHEREDGRGYPEGRKGDQISPAGRLCAVADSFCSMIADRAYSDRCSPIEAAFKLRKDPQYFPLATTTLFLTVAEWAAKYGSPPAESACPPAEARSA